MPYGKRSSRQSPLDAVIALGGMNDYYLFPALGARAAGVAMEALARDYCIKTAYFFQPVPAYGKTLTAEEQAVVGDLSYLALYRNMVDEVLRQRELGLAVFDLGDLFVDVEQAVHADGFHLQRSPFGESLGYRLMAKRVAANVASASGLKRKHPATRGLESSG